MEINRKSEPRISEPRSVDLGWNAFNLCPEIPNFVREQHGHVRGPSENAERMEVAEDKPMQRSSCIVDGKCRVYYDASCLERVRENHGIGMNGRNDIGTRAKILGSTRNGNKPYQRNAASGQSQQNKRRQITKRFVKHGQREFRVSDGCDLAAKVS
jgi:hypothetical protein